MFVCRFGQHPRSPAEYLPIFLQPTLYREGRPWTEFYSPVPHAIFQKNGSLNKR
jgi:hypothetical protein